MNKALLFALTFRLCSAAFAASVISTRPDDPKAIYLDTLAVDPDSSAGLQAAIDKAAGTGREGIVFVPTGRYTLTRTIYVWPGVRLIGYGATRPVFALPPHTPGFQKDMGVMVMFTGLGPSAPTRAGGPIAFPPPGTVPPNPNLSSASSVPLSVAAMTPESPSLPTFCGRKHNSQQVSLCASNGHEGRHRA